MADGRAAPTVADLVRNSQVIVVGAISSDTTPAGDVEGKITITRVLKGSVAAGEYLLAIPPCSNASDAPIYGVWFLAKSDTGALGFPDSSRYQACPVINSLIGEPAGELPAEWSYDSNISTEDKVAYELGYALHTSKGGAKPQIIGMSTRPFLGASKEAIRKVMTRLTTETDSDKRAIALRGLTEMGDPTSLQSVHANWQSIAGHDAPNASLQRYLFEVSIRHIYATEAATVTELGSIAGDTALDNDLRTAAAEALRNLHTPPALRTLAPLLNDSDPGLREEAIAGIACFANGVPPVDGSVAGRALDTSHPNAYSNSETMFHFAFGHEAISAREPYFLTYWKQWWQANAAFVLSGQ